MTIGLDKARLRWFLQLDSSALVLRYCAIREGLRIDSRTGRLATTAHPACLGSPLMHPWIATGPLEAMVTLATPHVSSQEALVEALEAVHGALWPALQGETLWPFSAPMAMAELPQVAQYGTSTLGLLKTRYRAGCAARYSQLRQGMAGISLQVAWSPAFWASFSRWLPPEGKEEGIMTGGYLHLIRNLYRYGWVLLYLFGASPLCAQHYPGGGLPTYGARERDYCYLPCATSLRNSRYGAFQPPLTPPALHYNALGDYVRALRAATVTSAPPFEQLDQRFPGSDGQLNTCWLQLEEELALPITPLGTPLEEGKAFPSEVLLRSGITQVALRALDLDPLSAIGVAPYTLRFCELLLWWCLLQESPFLSTRALQCARSYWDQVALWGRSSHPFPPPPFDTTGGWMTLQTRVALLLKALVPVANALDLRHGTGEYSEALRAQRYAVKDRARLPSSRLYADAHRFGWHQAGAQRGETHRTSWKGFGDTLLSSQRSRAEWAAWGEASRQAQASLEAQDQRPFEEYWAQFTYHTRQLAEESPVG